VDTTGDPRQILLGTLVAVCLGALVGLERQVAEEQSGGVKDFPGVRTFAFTALLGALAMLVSGPLGPWMAVAVFLAATSFLVMRYRYDVTQRNDPGFTTEVAALCSFTTGALAQSGALLVATAITIGMVGLLRSKRALHQFGRLLSPEDMEALIRFGVITGIVLPLLPDEPLDMLYGVLRPRDVWRMVVLISGMSFVAYALMRFRGGPRTYILSGLLAGFVSSTAATIAYARAAATAPEPTRRYEVMAMLAASSSFLRMLIVLTIVAPPMFVDLAPPLASMSLAALSVAWLLRAEDEMEPSPVLGNPLALSPALTFAAIYAVVLVVVAASRDLFGDAAVYVTSAIAAIPGSDAPTLSLARLMSDGLLAEPLAVRGVMIAAVANALAKVVITVSAGPVRFKKRVGAGLLFVAGVGALAAWLFFRGL